MAVSATMPAEVGARSPCGEVAPAAFEVFLVVQPHQYKGWKQSWKKAPVHLFWVMQKYPDKGRKLKERVVYSCREVAAAFEIPAAFEASAN